MSAPDLLTCAAGHFILAEHVSHLGYWPRWVFWQMVSPIALDLETCLPTLTAAITSPVENVIQWEIACHPLPDIIRPETVPWYWCLTKTWEQQRNSNHREVRDRARYALVRLDGCGLPDGHERPSRLPEWLAEAREIASGEWRAGATGRSPVLVGREWKMENEKWKLAALAALAAWRPAPRVLTPPETLREWVYFWQQVRQSESPLMKGIAARALLNMSETDLRAASIGPYGRVLNPPLLLRELATAIRVAAEKTTSKWDNHLLKLTWIPARTNPLPAMALAEVVNAWLDVTRSKTWSCRETAWRQLGQWNRSGWLMANGIDPLPDLVSAVRNEEDNNVLLALAQWVFGTEMDITVQTPCRRTLLQELEAHWQRRRESKSRLNKATAWLAGIHLQQAGVASEPPETFRKAYMSAVEEEWDSAVLFVLAQWVPAADAPSGFHREWQRLWKSRLRTGEEMVRLVAGFALVRQALAKGGEDVLRRAALEIWDAGTGQGGRGTWLLDSVVSRFQNVRTRLAAGEAPHFERWPPRSAQRDRPVLRLPSGRITDTMWEMER